MKKEIIFPRNRKEVFIDLIKYHKLDLIKTNLWMFLFGLLSIISIYLFIIISSKVPYLIQDGEILPLIENDIEKSIIITNLIYLNLLFILLFFTNIILFIGLSGGTYVISRLCYAKNDIDIKKDFFIGIKKNYKQFIYSSLLFSFSFFFLSFTFTLYFIISVPLVFQIIASILSILIFIFIQIVVFISLNYINFYKDSYFNIIKNSFKIGISKPFKTILLNQLSLIFFYLFFIPMIIPIFPILGSIFSFSFCLIISVLYSTSLFDEYINKSNYKTSYNLGIWKD